MPILANVHRCSICLNLYEEYLSACECEAAGIPVDVRYPQGTTLVFEEELEFGSRFSYCANSGIVKFSYPVLFNNKGLSRSHLWFHVVRDSRQRLLGVHRDQVHGWVSPVEYRLTEEFLKNKIALFTKYALPFNQLF